MRIEDRSRRADVLAADEEQQRKEKKKEEEEKEERERRRRRRRRRRRIHRGRRGEMLSASGERTVGERW